MPCTDDEFRGLRDRPQTPDEVAELRYVCATEEPPREFLEAQRAVGVYASRLDKADIRIDKVRDSEAGMYRVEIPVSPELPLAGALLGNSAIRERPEVFRRSLEKEIDVRAFRPPWMNLAPSPRRAPPLRRQMRRLDGRPIEPLWVFGADDRWEFRDASWPWGLVGKVFTSAGWTGSGALVGRRTLITAGHVVPWGGGSWWMRFVPAFYNGVSLHGSGIESFVSDARGYDVDGDVCGYDWAVCRLYNPLGDWLGYFGYNGYSDDWEDDAYWSIIGYPGAVAGAQRPSFQNGISVFDDDSDSNGGRELETRADLTPGNSGGPMFGWWNGDPRVIGVVSGQEEDYVFPFSSERGNVVAGGSGFTNMCAWGRSNWG